MSGFVLGPFTIMMQRGISTSPQPAYVGLVRSVTVREGQRRAMSEWKMREFKGLTCKLLNNLNYWNRLGLGS